MHAIQMESKAPSTDRTMTYPEDAQKYMNHLPYSYPFSSPSQHTTASGRT